MKPTMSKDGVKRFTVLIKTRVSRTDLIDGLRWRHLMSVPKALNKMTASAMVSYMREAMPSTRRAVMDAAIESISAEGAGVWAAVEDTPDEVRERACEIVDKLFPDLK